MKLCVLSALLILPLSNTYAQDLQIYQPANGNWNYLGVNGSQITPVGEWFFTFHTHYGRNPLMRRAASGSVEEVVISYLTTLEANVAIGLHERLEFGASLPYGFSSGTTSNIGVDDGSGVGDFRLNTKVVIVKPKEARQGFGLAFNSVNQLPTGEADRVSSQRRFASNNQLVFEFLRPKWRVAVNTGYRFIPRNEEANQLVSSSGLTWGVGFGYQFAKNLELLAETFQYRMDFDRSPMEALVAIRMKDKKSPVGVTFGGGTGVGGDYASVEFRVLGSITWKPGVDTVSSPRIKDQDFDFIPDDRDQCPLQPEDRDQYLDLDGCPDPDNDNDGILDVKDRCSNDPEDIDQFEDEDGCPDWDNDRDGIKDQDDKCPLKPETINQFEDEDGCPDQNSGDGQLITVGEKIFFANNESRILRRSYPVLAQVEGLMKRYPEIRLMRIEGHTDNKGTSTHNKALSQSRAEAVKLHLISLGIEMNRLQSVGYGDTQPIESNDTEQGRSLNRRVDFRIIDGPTDIFSVEDGENRAKPRKATPRPRVDTHSGVALPDRGTQADGSPYAVQVNASSDLEEANQVRDAYRQKGFAAYVLTVRKLEKTIHRVRLGPYWGKARIQQVKGVYETQSMDSGSVFVVKISKTEARKYRN